MNTDYNMKLNSLINKGLLYVYAPLVSFVIICPVISYKIASDLLNSEFAILISILSIFAAIFIGWIWWSYSIVKWKYNTFSKLSIVQSYDMYVKAVEVGLIWLTGSWFNKTEIWTQKDKDKWSEINIKIQELFNFKAEVIDELSKEDYLSTMSQNMINVTETAEAAEDIWDYVNKLVEIGIVSENVYRNQLVEFVYRNEDKAYDHILLPTDNKNIFLVIIMHFYSYRILGHIKLDLNHEYGLNIKKS